MAGFGRMQISGHIRALSRLAGVLLWLLVAHSVPASACSSQPFQDGALTQSPSVAAAVVQPDMTNVVVPTASAHSSMRPDCGAAANGCGGCASCSSSLCPSAYCGSHAGLAAFSPSHPLAAESRLVKSHGDELRVGLPPEPADRPPRV